MQQSYITQLLTTQLGRQTFKPDFTPPKDRDHMATQSCFCIEKCKAIILPAKSRSDVMFCLQSYGTYLS